mmetsp:Transcript_40310/g.66954  ORF Transcript_40310/g.66954 Transcript_40310/m.66954 type:complete len:371 (+) Transcript_40310:60-1172(+)
MLTLLLAASLLASAQVQQVRFEEPTGGARGICATSPLRSTRSVEEWWLISVSECQDRCGLSPRCTGFEFAEFGSDKRGYKRCDLQTSPVMHSIPANGFICMVKSSSLAVPSQTGPVIQSPTRQPGPGGSLPYGGAPQGPGQQLGAQQPASGKLFTSPPAGHSSTVSPPFSRPSAILPPPPPHMTAGGVLCKLTKACTCCPFLRPGADLTNGINPCYDLRNADLRGKNLEGTIMEGADLTCASFDGAFLKGANLVASSGEGVSFKRANMEGADITEVSLTGADFTGAMMFGVKAETANFEKARFDGANLNGAVFREANIAGAQFTGAKGMSTADFSFIQGMNTASGFNLGLAVNVANQAGTGGLGGLGWLG